jgi:hypothetical protein
VDQAYLTEEELAAGQDSVRDTYQEAREYINDWITTELLYQEAVRRGLATSDELRRQLEATKKQLAIAALLDQELYDDSSVVSENEMRAFYETESEKFHLREGVVNISFALFTQRDAANAFRSRILRGTSWDNSVLEFQKDSTLRPLFPQVATRQYFTEANLYPEELWKVSRTLAKDKVSYVIKTDVGYYVLMVHGLQRQGEIPDLQYIKNEIRDRILMEARRQKYEQFLADLRAKHFIEIRLDLTDTADTATVQ